MVGAPGRFVGLANYLELFRDEVFLRTAWNSVVYTVVAVGDQVRARASRWR